jgi:hypothetical protein
MSRKEAPQGPSYERLHERARELIAAGLLPRHHLGMLYAGYGSGRPCQLCEVAINDKEVEYELEFQTDIGSPKNLVHFHLACHAIWDYERKHMGP